MRPSTEIVKCACSFNAEVNLVYRGAQANAKSLLGILLLAANKGSKITVHAFGDDAKEAVSSLIELAQKQFYMQY